MSTKEEKETVSKTVSKVASKAAPSTTIISPSLVGNGIAKNPTTGCCEPTKLPAFVRPTGKKCVTQLEFIPCDSRIKTIATGHYLYEDDMPMFHYDVGSIQDAEAYFGKKQTKTISGVEQDALEKVTTNYMVNQPNVNEPVPSVHLQPLIDSGVVTVLP